MRNLVSNWVFTLIETVLLAVFAVLMLLVDSILNVLVGIALIVYIAFIVLSKVVTYRGVIQLIALLEFFVITVLAVFVIVDYMPLASVDAVNFTVGVAMWFRATTEILHSYHGQGEGRQAKKSFNAWKIFFYILLLTFGTFIASTSLFDDAILKYLIAGVAIAGAVIMAVLTFTNYRDYRELHPKPVKQPKNDPALNSAKTDGELSDAKTEAALGEGEEMKSLPAPETDGAVEVYMCSDKK